MDLSKFNDKEIYQFTALVGLAAVEDDILQADENNQAACFYMRGVLSNISDKDIIKYVQILDHAKEVISHLQGKLSYELYRKEIMSSDATLEE